MSSCFITLSGSSQLNKVSLVKNLTFLQRSSNTTSPHSTIWLQHAKKKLKKVKVFSLCIWSRYINPLMLAAEQKFEITVNTISHYLPFTRARWRRQTPCSQRPLGEGWGGLRSVGKVSGRARTSPPQKPVDHQKSLRVSYSTRNEKFRSIFLRTL